MTWLQSVFLGALQGITEFLPVSSSGHLLVARHFMGLGEIPVLFDVLMHVPTLAAICIVFRSRLGALFVSLWHLAVRRTTPDDRTNLRLVVVLLVATAMTALVGLALTRVLPEDSLPLRAVAVLFLVTGMILVASRFLGGDRNYERTGVTQGLIVGFGQGLGVLPGISRSGISITACLASGMAREQAGELAFLISIPAILGAVVLKSGDAGALNVPLPTLVAGLVTSFVTGYFALRLLLRLIEKGRLFLFSLYLIPLGVAVLIAA